MTTFAFQLPSETSMFWILVIIAVCFIVMAIAIAIIATAVLRVAGTVRQLQERVEPLIATANGISAQGKEIAEKFGDLSTHLTTATKHLSDSAGLIKEELGEIKLLVGQTAETAREKVALVSHTIDRTNGQILDTTDFIQAKIVDPARELAAIMAGLKRGLEVLLAPSPRQLDRAYGDDEMFIG